MTSTVPLDGASRRRPSSSSVFRVVRAKVPPLAFSMHPSSILANRLDPQPRTKDDEDEGDNDAPCRGRQKNGVTIQYSTLVTTADLTPLQGESI